MNYVSYFQYRCIGNGRKIIKCEQLFIVMCTKQLRNKKYTYSLRCIFNIIEELLLINVKRLCYWKNDVKFTIIYKVYN